MSGSTQFVSLLGSLLFSSLIMETFLMRCGNCDQELNCFTERRRRNLNAWMVALYTERQSLIQITKLVISLPSHLQKVDEYISEMAAKIFKVELSNIRIRFSANGFVPYEVIKDCEEIGAKIAVVRYDKKSRGYWFQEGEERYRCIIDRTFLLKGL